MLRLRIRQYPCWHPSMGDRTLDRGGPATIIDTIPDTELQPDEEGGVDPDED